MIVYSRRSLRTVVCKPAERELVTYSFSNLASFYFLLPEESDFILTVCRPNICFTEDDLNSISSLLPACAHINL